MLTIAAIFSCITYAKGSPASVYYCQYDQDLSSIFQSFCHLYSKQLHTLIAHNSRTKADMKKQKQPPCSRVLCAHFIAGVFFHIFSRFEDICDRATVVKMPKLYVTRG